MLLLFPPLHPLQTLGAQRSLKPLWNRGVHRHFSKQADVILTFWFVWNAGTHRHFLAGRAPASPVQNAWLHPQHISYIFNLKCPRNTRFVVWKINLDIYYESRAHQSIQNHFVCPPFCKDHPVSRWIASTKMGPHRHTWNFNRDTLMLNLR